MKLQPSGDRAIIRPIIEKTTKGGIFIPENAREFKMIRGTVLAMGTPGKDEPKPNFREGDIVHYISHEGYPLEWEGEELRLLALRQVLAVEQARDTEEHDAPQRVSER